MTLEQAVAALCTHLEAERVALESLYHLLEQEQEVLRSLDRERMEQLNQQKLHILQNHQELLKYRAYYLQPFTPPTGGGVNLSYICYHLPLELRNYLQPYQEALKSLALAIKASQARNQEFARNAQQVIRATRKRLENKSPEHQRKTYSAKGKMNIQIPRGRGYGKG